MVKEVAYLEHVISKEGIKPNSNKIKAIKNYQISKTCKEIKAYLRLLGYYCNFIPNFAKLMKPFTNCLRKGNKININDENFKELAEECGILVGSCYEILTAKLKMHRDAAKFVPRLMIDDQEANCVRVCQELLDRSDEDEYFLSRIITGDESWVYGYDIKMKVQSSHGRVKRLQDPRKLAKFDRMSRGSSQFFWMLRLLFTTSTFLKAPQSTRFTTLKY